MKLMKFADALKMGKEKVREALVPVKVMKARKQAELEMCQLDERIANLECDIQEMCSDEGINFSKLIDKQDDLALLERKREQYRKILNEMFGDEE